MYSSIVNLIETVPTSTVAESHADACPSHVRPETNTTVLV